MVTIYRGNRPTRCNPALLPMFEDRKRLFVDLLGWGVPVVETRYEVDQFDDAASVYLVESDLSEPHLGSLRLLPTTRPHILGTLFEPLCDDGAPSGPDVFEITRLCLPSRFGAARRLDTRNCLISAMVDYALAEGIGVLTGVVEAGFRAQVLTMGWRCAALGPVVRIGGSELGAFRLEIDAATPALLAATGIYSPGALGAPRATAA